MTPEQPHLSDFVDWEKVRQTKEYQDHMMSHLRIKLEKVVFPPDYWERLDRLFRAVAEECDDSATPEDLNDAFDKLETRTEEELDMGADIAGLRSIADVEAYVRAHNVGMNVQKEVRELEKTYLSDIKGLERLKEELAPLLDDTREFFGWKKPKDPNLQ